MNVTEVTIYKLTVNKVEVFQAGSFKKAVPESAVFVLTGSQGFRSVVFISNYLPFHV
jgi:hypothetical protein